MRSILNKLVKKGQTRTFATGHGKNKVNSVVLTEEGQKKLINFIEEKKDVTYMSKMRHPLAIKQGSKIKEADAMHSLRQNMKLR